jgi:hypothetical protein
MSRKPVIQSFKDFNFEAVQPPSESKFDQKQDCERRITTMLKIECRKH